MSVNSFTWKKVFKIFGSQIESPFSYFGMISILLRYLKKYLLGHEFRDSKIPTCLNKYRNYAGVF